MKKILFTAMALAWAGLSYAQMPEMQYVATGAQLNINKLGAASIAVTISNPNAQTMSDAPVCIALPPNCTYHSATVTVKGKEVPSQMDDLDGDGIKDELAFVVDVKSKGKVVADIAFSTDEAVPGRYPARVSAQMFFADKDKSHKVKQHIPTDTVSEVVDNMYNVMHHHGPAFESELVAYRIYFDKKQSTDLYGKKIRQLELADGLWYSAEKPELLSERSFGDDIILVGQTISLGTLRGWDETNAKNPMVMIDPFKWRQAHIVAKGPVRTVVDMNVEGWQYKGRTLNLKSRYILYAGQRECEVIQQFEGNTEGLEFVTGAIKVGSLTTKRGGTKPAPQTWHHESGTCATYGTDWPDNNAKLYPVMQPAGLAVCVPEANVLRYIEDANQVLFGIKTNADNSIRYKMSFCAPDKETFAKWTAPKWFKHVEAWKDVLPVEVTLNK